VPAPTTAPSWSSYAPTIAMTVTSCGPTQPHDSKRCARPTARSWKPSLPTEPATTPTRTAASGPEGSAAVGVATSSHPRLAEEATQHRGLVSHRRDSSGGSLASRRRDGGQILRCSDQVWAALCRRSFQGCGSS
jgi:hypothetical protein